MAKISADNILLDFAFFLALAIPFGIASDPDVQSTLNTIFGPWPTLSSVTPPSTKCAPTDFLCQANAGIAQATAFIAVPFLWVGSLILSALNRLDAFGNLGLQLTLGPTSSLTAIPGASIVVFGLIVIVAFELFRMFRGSPSGA